MEKDRDEFDNLLRQHAAVKHFKVTKSNDILLNFHYSQGPKFKLTSEEDPKNERLNLSSTTICSCALSQYIDLWKENKIYIEGDFKPLKEYYIYIIKGLTRYMDKNQKPATDESIFLNTSTDEFVLLKILSYLKLIQNRIIDDKNNEKYNFGNDVVLDLITLLYNEYNRENIKFKYKGDTHPFIYYAFITALSDWRKELISRENASITQEDLNKVLNEIYDMGKYEMYRQIALYKSNDRSLFDVKRLIYSLLIVTRSNRYSNDMIRREVLKIFFEEQLDTGLWPVGNVVNIDFSVECGKINRNSFRIVAMSSVLSSIECLNDLLFHEDIVEDLEPYQPKLYKTYEWITNRLRERDISISPKNISDYEKIIIEMEALFNSGKGSALKDIVEYFNREGYRTLKSDQDKIKIDKLKEYLADKINHLLVDNQMPKELEPHLRENILFYDPFIVRSLTRGNFNLPLGWYPEYEATRVSKSWVAGHTLLFLMKYCELISRHIEKKSKEYLQAIDSKDLEGSWDTIRSSYKIKEVIKNMIIGSGESNPEYRSAFIFGPPGTGKSSIAKILAKELGWNYVEITPGQFLEDGEPNIIKNATSLFKRLTRMGNTVIFFDEVDQLVELRKENTGSSSKWILTSLLPKFQNLHNIKDIKFFLATNKIDNVDWAMRRSGRIDFVLPMGAVCWRDRMKMLRDEVKKLKNNMKDNSNLKLAYDMFPELFLEDGQENIKDDNAINRLKKKNIKSDGLMKYLIKTDYMMFPDIDDLAKDIGNSINKSKQATSDLYKLFFEKDNIEYLNYWNHDLELFHKVQLPTKKDDHFRLNPTLQTKINKQFGFNEIVNDNSFSSLLLCEGDIHFASLLDKLSTDWQDDHKNINARSNLSIYLLRFAPNHNDAFNAYSNLTYRRLEIQDNEIHLKEYIKIHLNIEIVGDISINDLDLLEQKTKDQYDEEITNRIKGYYDILKLKNDLIQQLNWIIENDDLSNIEHLPEFDKDTMKYIEAVGLALELSPFEPNFENY